MKVTNTAWKVSVLGVILVRIFPRNRIEYGEILRISPYSVRMRENADQNNYQYGHFLGSLIFVEYLILYIMTVVVYCY